MTKKTKIIIGIVSIATGIAALAGTLIFMYRKNQRETTLAIISNKFPQWNQAEKDALEKMEASYLEAWAKAINDSKSTFLYNGKKYSTQTGRSLE